MNNRSMKPPAPRALARARSAPVREGLLRDVR